MEQNQLTRDLYAAGYTRENHPSFVYWSDWQNFGYLFEALLKFIWETPCGLLVAGESSLGRGLACSDASFQGIDYCPENDNPLLRCPYERKDCPHSISGFPVPLCPCHTTGKRYSYEQSVEKVETERSERQHRQYMEITGGVYCACVVAGGSQRRGSVASPVMIGWSRNAAGNHPLSAGSPGRAQHTTFRWCIVAPSFRGAVHGLRL